MIPQVLKVTTRAVEIATCIVFLGLGVLIFFEGIRLGPWFGVAGPEPGFVPFMLAVLLMIGTLAVAASVIRVPDLSTFFEERQEVVDLLKVGIPVIIAMLSVRWLGLYLMAGIYVFLFAWWYDNFRWWKALAGGILIPIVLYLLFRYGFGLPMPTSIFFGQTLFGIRIMV